MAGISEEHLKNRVYKKPSRPAQYRLRTRTSHRLDRKRRNWRIHEASKRIDAELPDWTREKPSRFWDPSRKLLLTVRRYQYWRNKRGILPGFFRRVVVLRHRLWSVVTGADIDLMTQIGGGLLLPHANGVVIHPRATIGVNCLIHQQVTIGTRNDEPSEAWSVPVIEEHVKIYSGAKILGPVRIGAHATIGANSVVLKDVPENATVVGVPAKRVG
jgi:serine O-acetyltransferase